MLELAIPAGHETRRLVIIGPDEAAALLRIEFENWRYVDGYDAVYSYEDGEIEAAVRFVRRPPGLYGFDRIFSMPANSEASDPQSSLTLRSGDDSGVELTLWARDAARGVLFAGPIARRAPSLAIGGVTLKNHDHARQILESYGNSLFFQIDAKLGFPLQLARERQREPARLRRSRKGTAADLFFPQIQYDHEPMSLYWYGRAAAGMPLLQFLAYYQVVEFYFPMYTQAEVRRRLGNILKDPAFNLHSDRQIGRLVAALSSSGSRNLWGEELSQLRATLNATIDGSEVRDFISAAPLDGYFEKKARQLTNTTLRVAASDEELVSKTAERIYDIRCKIVHTKEDRNSDASLLLPFSQEADRLGPEIDLVEFVARRVLAAAGKPLGSR